MADFLYSHYIIDGQHQALTPERMLADCTLDPPLPPDGDPGTVADERVDPAPGNFAFSDSRINKYAAAVDGIRRSLPLPYSGAYTVGKIGEALLDAIWMSGHFRLGDLNLKADWKWNGKAMGNMAAFYSSVEAASEFLDTLGVKISRYTVSEGVPSVTFKATTVAEEDEVEEEESLFRELPYRTANPRISRRRRCPSAILPEESDWLLYIPFDTCEYRLGGSVLAEALDARPATAPELGDADYFIDCYEVVRELVEDGVVKAGATVFSGGLLTAVRSMASGGIGADISIQEVCKAYGGESPVRVLFGEIPGVVVQVADADYDYVDAELLLQDVAYFPLGHPAHGVRGVKLSAKTDIQGILNSLLNTLEGED